MDILIAIAFLVIGFILLFYGAEALVSGSSSIGLRLGLTPIVTGITIVGFGTSSPELFVSVGSAVTGAGDIALGNVIGSNITNIGLILGISAVLMPMTVKWQFIKVETPIMIGFTLLSIVFILGGLLSRLEGIIMLIMMIGYLWFSVVQAQKGTPPEISEELTVHPLWKDLLFIFLGLTGLAIGAHLFVNGATTLAKIAGLSELIIGLTIVAFGTSLPELATSIVASFKGQGDMAIGNIVGSNIFNIMGILGITAIIQELSTLQVSTIDLVTMAGLSILLLPYMWTGRSISRVEGGIFLVIYLAYTTFIIANAR